MALAGRRGKVRQLKRDLVERNCPAAITALLAHSVRLGHKKLALLRCLQAERMGVTVPDILTRYCTEVAAAMPMELLVGLSMRASTACSTSPAKAEENDG